MRLEDEIAEEAVKESARAHVEAVLERGIEATKRRTRVRDYSDVVKVCAMHDSYAVQWSSETVHGTLDHQLCCP